MSWEMLKLGDIVTVKTGKYDANHSVEDGVYPFYTCALEPFRSNTFSFDDELILLPGNGANVGEVMYYNGKVEAYQRTYVLHEIKASVKYVYYYLKYCWKKTLTNQQFGSATNYIRINNITSLEIPLPPLSTQQRIAEILDKADALRRKDQALLKKYDDLAQAIFMDMFGDPVKNEMEWKKERLGNSIKKVQIGPFGTQLHESDYVLDGIPVINPMHIGDLKIKPNYKYSISKEKYNELDQYHLSVGDVILARRGEMGRCAIVGEKEKGFLCGTGSLFISVDKNKLEPLFLVYVLSRKSSRIALENASAGTTMSNLNKNIVNEFKVILPNIEKQRAFVKAIRISEQNIDLTNQLLSNSNTLFQSLLQQAFKGELV